MQRITISLDKDLASSLDAMVQQRSYTSRSEAMRDLVREGLQRWDDEQVDGNLCVANLSFILDRRLRGISTRLAEMQHANHDLVAARATIILDHYHSLETLMLKGATTEVRALADAVRSERGVRFGALNILQVSMTDTHDHDGDDAQKLGSHHHHRHLSPSP